MLRILLHINYRNYTDNYRTTVSIAVTPRVTSKLMIAELPITIAVATPRMMSPGMIDVSSV